ncbi:hypothetical protein BKA69DRAFT_1123347 [Paraphysoderma sedebokerense]|nr:hypothetical protein BKA69DRAFT_1123347 [Paraphysoderma sedebokerense]
MANFAHRSSEPFAFPHSSVPNEKITLPSLHSLLEKTEKQNSLPPYPQHHSSPQYSQKDKFPDPPPYPHHQSSSHVSDSKPSGFHRHNDELQSSSYYERKSNFGSSSHQPPYSHHPSQQLGGSLSKFIEAQPHLVAALSSHPSFSIPTSATSPPFHHEHSFAPPTTTVLRRPSMAAQAQSQGYSQSRYGSDGLQRSDIPMDNDRSAENMKQSSAYSSQPSMPKLMDHIFNEISELLGATCSLRNSVLTASGSAPHGSLLIHPSNPLVAGMLPRREQVAELEQKTHGILQSLRQLESLYDVGGRSNSHTTGRESRSSNVNMVSSGAPYSSGHSTAFRAPSNMPAPLDNRSGNMMPHSQTYKNSADGNTHQPSDDDIDEIRKRRYIGSSGGSNYKRRTRRSGPPPSGRCHSCNTTETPEWRRGPDGKGTLCNACGLHFAKMVRAKKNKEKEEKERLASLKDRGSQLAESATPMSTSSSVEALRSPTDSPNNEDSSVLHSSVAGSSSSIQSHQPPSSQQPPVSSSTGHSLAQPTHASPSTDFTPNPSFSTSPTSVSSVASKPETENR